MRRIVCACSIVAMVLAAGDAGAAKKHHKGKKKSAVAAAQKVDTPATPAPAVQSPSSTAPAPAPAGAPANGGGAAPAATSAVSSSESAAMAPRAATAAPSPVPAAPASQAVEVIPAARPVEESPLPAASATGWSAPESTPAPAADRPLGAAARERELFPITAGIRAGAVFPQLVSRLSTNVDLTLDVGYLLPVLEQRIAVMAGFGYTQPTRSQTVSDPRLAAGSSYTYDLTEQQMLVSLGAMGRLLRPGSPVNGFGQIGVRMDLQRSEVAGSAASDGFGTNRETRTEAGLWVAAGCEVVAFGTGAIAADLAFTWADLRHRITGPSAAGGLMLEVGYHFLL